MSAERAHGRRAEVPRATGVEGLIARLLLWGGLVSIVLMALGLALYAAHGGFAGRTLELRRFVPADRTAHSPDVFVSLSEVAAGLTARPIDGRAVIALGLVLLLVTPVVGAAAAIPGFLVAGDYRYAAIAAIVLAMLVLGALFSGGVG